MGECQDWANKAAALASYAKQSEYRIWRAAFAAERSDAAGKLTPGANQKIGETAHNKVLTRKDAAERAGLSERQRNGFFCH
jgi:hypothetical protein